MLVTLSRTDRYRGAAFLIFRYFALRRELGKLKIWAETGKYRAGRPVRASGQPGRLCRTVGLHPVAAVRPDSRRAGARLRADDGGRAA